MPLQNRVTPLGTLIADPARGLVYGNRGCLHGDDGRVRRRYDGKRWIACRLRFRGRRRHPLMQPGRFTELFFLDEATAFAAGHRPCAECRRADYVRFAALMGQAGADAIDAQLHAERVDPESRAQRRYDASLDDLPDGAFVLRDGTPWLVHGHALLRWTPSGYGARVPRPAGERSDLITPPSLLAVLRAGWRPVVPLLHPSAYSASGVVAPDVLEFVGSALPPPPARLLEVGAGSGELADALTRLGYDVLAIDPASESPSVSAVALHELDEPAGSFDAAVAVVSLHHVEPLAESCRTLARLVKPGGILVVDEFDVERLDERAAAWWLAQHGGAGHDGPSEPREVVADLRAHIHPLRRLREELAGWFSLEPPVRGAYLHRWDLPPGLLDAEQRLIASGELPATGARLVGTRRR
jgi:SAM-dependent methyltransferase